MNTITVPYRKDKHDTGTFKEIDIQSGRSNKYKVGETYQLKAVSNNRTKIKMVVQLTEIQQVAWEEVTHDMAREIIGNIEFVPPLCPNETRTRVARKGDLMMYLMKAYQDSGFKGKSSSFTILTFTVQSKTPKRDKPKKEKPDITFADIKAAKPKIINGQSTLPTFEQLKGNGE